MTAYGLRPKAYGLPEALETLIVPESNSLKPLAMSHQHRRRREAGGTPMAPLFNRPDELAALQKFRYLTDGLFRLPFNGLFRIEGVVRRQNDIVRIH